jgi:serine/threonine-protein kinase
MTGSAGPFDAGLEDDPALADLVEEFANRLQRGEAVDASAYAREHPERAEKLRQLLPGVQVLADLGQSGLAPADAPGAGPGAAALGDFRVLREVGRGGMGVVYEAVQLSLDRRVALKVLPFAAALDPRQLQRFQNEAQAAAQLHHTNIVPVFGVGCERGVHFYAMQFIEGRTLAALIRGFRRQAGSAAGEPGGPAGALAEEAASGRRAPSEQGPADEPPTGPDAPAPCPGAPAAAQTTTPPVAALSTERSTRSPAFFRTVANLGVQAAEALEHAHQLGVVHRDIKPANLLVDVRGNLWVTDFGLARCQSQAGLTMTGDLVGTLRYMSPEQALARQAVVDHRTDIYSLGVTLYELLTLEPAFDGGGREESPRSAIV